jgi:GT2 family glycosyltransferase
MPAVAIVIPTLVAGELLESCLQALLRQTFRDFEIVVVNNGGPPVYESNAAVVIRVIAPGANLGFGAAINLGASATKAELIATINDDAEADPQWLARLVSEIRMEPRMGMCASRIRMFATETIDSAGMLICFDGSSKQRGGQMRHTAFADAAEVLLPSACAAIYRREMLDDIGWFDEEFFLYCEDTDLGLRAQWAGWQCGYAPDATVQHRYSASAGAASPLKARYVERNRLWVAIKNFPPLMLAALPVHSALRYLFQWMAARSGEGSAARFFDSGQSAATALAIVAWAHIETLRRLPGLLRKRAAIRASRRISPVEFSRILNRHRIGIRELARA